MLILCPFYVRFHAPRSWADGAAARSSDAGDGATSRHLRLWRLGAVLQYTALGLTLQGSPLARGALRSDAKLVRLAIASRFHD